MNETLNLHRQRTKWTADIELDNKLTDSGFDWKKDEDAFTKLTSNIKNKIEAGHNIIVMGDFNSEYSKLSEWMRELGLVDLMQKKHGDCP